MSLNKNSMFISNLNDLPHVSKKLYNKGKEQKIWIFEGPMGAGKTTLINEICKVLNVTDTVNSPSFSIVNEYRTTDNIPIYHFDFYRIHHEHEAFEIGCEEYFKSGQYCFVEWPSRIRNLLPDHYFVIKIKMLSLTKRAIDWEIK